MSNKLIKKYKFIEKDSLETRQTDRVLKSGTYKTSENRQPRADIKASQKKKKNPPACSESHPERIKTGLSLQMPESVIADKASLLDIPSAEESSIEKDDNSLAALETRLKTEYEARLKDEAMQAYSRGLHEGKANAVAINDARIEAAQKIFDNIKVEMGKSAEEFFAEIEKVAMDMSMHLASKIIGDAVNAVPEIVKGNVDKCLAVLAGAGEVQIKINPSDYETIKGYLPSLEQKSGSRFSFVLDPDRNIEKGGCFIEFEGSVIDGRIETQFQKIKEQMEILT